MTCIPLSSLVLVSAANDITLSGECPKGEKRSISVTIADSNYTLLSNMATAVASLLAPLAIWFKAVDSAVQEPYLVCTSLL